MFLAASLDFAFTSEVGKFLICSYSASLNKENNIKFELLFLRCSKF